MTESSNASRGRLRTPPTGGAIAVTISLFVACLVFTMFFFGVDVINSMNVAGCDSDCNVGVAQAALLLMPVAGAIAIALALIATIVHAILRLRIWIPPVVALGLIIATFVTATILINASL